MTNPKARIYARNGKRGIDLYLDISGTTHYLTTRRSNGLLFLWLKNGMTMGELLRVKPKRNSKAQKRNHYAKHLVKIVQDYIKYELVA